MTYEEERSMNFQAYERLRSEILARYLGQYISIAQGKIMKVAVCFEEADRAIAGYRHALVFQGGDEPVREPVYVR